MDYLSLNTELNELTLYSKQTFQIVNYLFLTVF